VVHRTHPLLHQITWKFWMRCQRRMHAKQYPPLFYQANSFATLSIHN
jgi:hypothetical protein